MKMFLGLLNLMVAFAPAAFADVLPNFDATHCELYVNSFGVADQTYQDTQEKVLDVDLMIDADQLSSGMYVEPVRAGAGLNVRTLIAELGADGNPVITVEERPRIVIADHQFGSSYRVYYIYEQRSPPQSEFVEITDLAFFVDVLRTDGETIRLWLRDQGRAFTMQTVFGALPTTDRSLGSGVIRYPEPSSVIYDFKRRCAG